jgi:hypothetical protein
MSEKIKTPVKVDDEFSDDIVDADGLKIAEVFETPDLYYGQVASQIVTALNSLPALVEALRAWQSFLSECKPNNPCPDITLRQRYRDEAERLTAEALKGIPQ